MEFSDEMISANFSHLRRAAVLNYVVGCVIEELHWAPTYTFQSVPVFIARKPGYIQVSTKPDGYNMGSLVKETGW